MGPPPWLVALERSLVDDQGEESLATALVVLASVAGRSIELTDDERRGVARRSLLLLAAGGDPTRGLDLNGPAVETLAAELDRPPRRSSLSLGIERLRSEAAGLPYASEALHGLVHSPDVAWRAYACSILAEELGDEG